MDDRDAEAALSALGLMNSRNATNAQSKSLDSLSGIAFEKFITQLLRVMGFRTQITKASGDGGIDIVAILDKQLPAAGIYSNARDLPPIHLLEYPY